jgi:hypothetical protein
MLGRLCAADFGQNMSLWHCPWPKTKSWADFSQIQAKTKVVCSQHMKQGTAESFHFLNVGPMSDETMLGRLSAADFGHTMSLWHCLWPKGWLWQISARAKPNQGSRLFAANTPSKALLNHISFPPY